MGLDMFLTKKTYVGMHNREALKIEGVEGIDPEKVSYIEEEVGYWRKANAIHNWFVNNVQGGTDDCNTYYVPREKLEELRDTVEAVLDSLELIEGLVANGYRILEDGRREPILEAGKTVVDSSVAEERLPSVSGFFFGGTDYDQYYVDDLEHTRSVLEEALEDENGAYYYHSSW